MKAARASFHECEGYSACPRRACAVTRSCLPCMRDCVPAPAHFCGRQPVKLHLANYGHDVVHNSPARTRAGARACKATWLTQPWFTQPCLYAGVAVCAEFVAGGCARSQGCLADDGDVSVRREIDAVGALHRLRNRLPCV